MKPIIPREVDGSDGPDLVVAHNPTRSALAIVVKRVIQSFFYCWVLPRLWIYWINRRVWGGDRAFLAASESIAGIPGMRGVYCRQAFYKATLASCGRDSYFGWQSVFSMTVARIGNNVYIGRRCNLGFADVGDNVMLADGVQILSGGREHGRGTGDQSHQEKPQEFRRTVIGAGAWLGTNAVILADVGAGTIIGAGAVVTQPIPDRVLAVGIPARIVRQL